MSIKISSKRLRLRLVILLLASAAAQGQSAADDERFQLFNECRPMRLAVEGLHDAARQIGLTEERLRLVAESRLRAERHYTEDLLEAATSSLLYIQVTVESRGLGVTVQYHKYVSDSVSGLSNLATTWLSGSTGTHGQSANFVVQTLSGHLDKFLAEYLRVNAPYCK